MAKESKVDWGAQDWELRDVDLAEMNGVSRERVRQVRKALMKPRSPMWHRHVGTAADTIASMDTAGMTPGEVAGKSDCSEAYARQCLTSMRKRYRRPPDGRMVHKYAWETVTPQQWRAYRDKDVAEMLGIGNVAVVTQWRRRKGIVKKHRIKVREAAV